MASRFVLNHGRATLATNSAIDWTGHRWSTAEALFVAYEVLQGLHDRGVLDTFKGALNAGDTLLETVEFLLLVELELYPGSAAPSRLIFRSTTFADQTFKSYIPGSAQKLLDVLRERDRIPDYTRRLFEARFQLRLSLFDR